MADTTSRDDEAYPEMGLQFNPTPAAGESQSMHSPTTPLGESQEIMVGNAGEAILLGDEIDLESEDGDHPFASNHQSKGGLCPNWMRSSSPKTKGLLGLIAILLLTFVGVMIGGVVQLSSPTDKNDASSVSEQNTVTDPTEATPSPTPAPTPEPSQSTTTATDSPASESMTIPISMSVVNVVLPAYLEMKVPNFSDGLSTTEEQNWNLIGGAIESTISTSLSESLPSDYTLDSVQVDKFDGFVTSSIRKRKRSEGRRYLQNDSETIHTVLYSSSVTVNCLESDCTAATATVASVTSDLSQLELLRVSVDTETSADTEAPILSSTGSPTKSPIASTPAPVTPAPTAGTTKTPTVSPTKQPVTNSPTGPVLLQDRDDNCGKNEPCGRCLGECSDDDECEEGLLCFKRGQYDLIPGCGGPGKQGQSYCYDPFADGLTENDLLALEEKSCDKKDRCEKCQGDCDEDEDCEKNLFCFRRGDFELVPGCAGQGSYGTDYCFDLEDLEGSGDF